MEIEGKVVVITGAASGIGFGLAEEFAAAGARLVLLDIEQGALDDAVAKLAEGGQVVQGFRVDVRRQSELDAVAAQIADEFGGTDILCNSAGVLAAPGWIWDAPREDVEWVFSVNFWGVLNGVQAFVPRMIERGTPAHVLNTSSVTAISPQAGASSYMMSKGAIVALSETLAQDLGAVQAPIAVSVVLPEHFRTRLGSAHRNRPTSDEPDRTWGPIWDEADDPMLRDGADPRILGRRVVDAVRRETFWVLPPADDAMSVAAIQRLHAIEESFG